MAEPTQTPRPVTTRIVIAALVAVALLALAWGWHAQRERDAAQLQLGLDSARVISESFAATNRLKVGEVSGKLIARSQDPGLIDLLDSSQTMVAPWSVDYFIDLSQIGPSDFSWNAEARTLLVEIPEPIVGRPNIDIAGAQVSQSGLYISRRAGMRLQRKTADALSARAAQSASSVENLKRVRTSAVKAVRANVKAPLNAAGMDDVTVDIRFRSQRNTNDDVWDYTTPIDQVAETLERMKGRD